MTTAEIRPGRAASLGEGWLRQGIALTRVARARAATIVRAGVAADTRHLGLWAPVGVGAGALAYFSLRSEPSFSIAAAPLVVSAMLLLHARARPFARAAIFIALGFFIADIRTSLASAPILAREMTPRLIEGRLVSVDEGPRFRRLIIAVSAIDGLEKDALPRRIRINWRGAAFAVSPGDAIALRAGLSPPPAPEIPGGFDFARMLYFERVGAVGYAVSAPQKIDAPPASRFARLAAAIERARLGLTRRILAAAPGEGGAVVAAAVTGHRGAIGEETDAAFRNSGLTHLIAISGLNMALATGLIFFTLRGALALIEPVARRYPVKKWAAAAALGSGFGYLLISGAEWSALRAFIMTAIVFVAILFDRRAISLRNLAVAATLILIVSPEAVLHAGFQMSFAAVAALVAFYEWASARADPDRSYTMLARARRYFIGVALTDIVAASATAPFSIYHFNQAALYSLPANIVAIPIMGFCVMPMAVLGVILSPLGLDTFAWRAAAAGVDAITALGAFISGLPGAVATIAQWPPATLCLLTIGGLWLCLNAARWRYFGLAAIPAAALVAVLTPAPVVFVASEGDNAGALAEVEGAARLAMFEPRRSRFAAEVWMEQAGLDAHGGVAAAMSEAGRCDASGCVVRIRGADVSFLKDPLALPADCARAALVVALFPVSEEVRAACAATLIDRRSVWDEGAHAAWISRKGVVRVRAVAEDRGVRPWVGDY